MKLNQIAGNPGSHKKRMRVGRGIGSGKGKTGGRGGKGQTARTGVRMNGFEGGQTPLHRRLPKRGFNNIHRVEYAIINLGDLQRFVDAGKIGAKDTLTPVVLAEKGIIRRGAKPLKLLGKGEITSALKITVNAASASAKAALEKAGGSVEIVAFKAPKSESAEKAEPKKKASAKKPAKKAAKKED